MESPPVLVDLGGDQIAIFQNSHKKRENSLFQLIPSDYFDFGID